MLKLTKNNQKDCYHFLTDFSAFKCYGCKKLENFQMENYFLVFNRLDLWTQIIQLVYEITFKLNNYYLIFKLNQKMSQQQPIRQTLQPIYPIPIISAPQPLFPSTNKMSQLNPKDELEVYKRQYSRLIKENNMLLAHLAKITEEKQALEIKYNSLNIDPSSHDDKKKRVRRTAGQIVRQYSCCIEKCGKSYGTEASLAQHVKLKHGNIYGTKEYEDHVADLRRKVALKEVPNGENKEQENGHISP